MKILENHPTFEAVKVTKESGIRRDAAGTWHAVKQGRLEASFTGAGSKARAIQAAGSNTMLP